MVSIEKRVFGRILRALKLFMGKNLVNVSWLKLGGEEKKRW